MSETTLTISIVLPVRNQAGLIAPAVTECMAVASHNCADYEIILVNDGSTDATRDQVDSLAAAYAPVMVLHQPQPRGYAAALRSAWTVARGDYLFATTISGPAGVAELPRLLTVLDNHAVVVGYRAGLRRTPLAQIYATAVSAFFGTDLRDPSLQFALFRSDVADLLPETTPDGLAHAEIYTRARRMGLSVAQVAISGRRGREAASSAALIELARYSPPSNRRQGAFMGSCAMVVAGGIWLLRRRRKV